MNTRTQYRAYDVNQVCQGYGETLAEAAADMAATLGEVLKDQDEPEGAEWYVLSFEQEQNSENYEWEDLDEGYLVAES